MLAPSMQKWPAHQRIWATPKATDADRGGRCDLLQQARGNESPSGHFGMWPTPDASVAQFGEKPNTWLARREREKLKGQNGNGMGMPLTIAVQIWPTPTARDGRTLKGARDRPNRTGGASLAHTMIEAGHTSGHLNPEWVEWLMGFPIGWTDCGPSETRSSRKSPNGSDGGS
jgi:hypothetical protein